MDKKEKYKYIRNCRSCGEEYGTNNHRLFYCQTPHPYTCIICNKTYYRDGKAGKTCSKECLKEYQKKLNLERYGVEHWSQLESSKKKLSKSLSKKEVQDKRKETLKNNLKEKYGEGITNPGQLESSIKKRKATMLERYGVEYSAQSDEILSKMKRTNFEKYGVENVFSSKEIQEKIKVTTKEKYGVEYSGQIEYIRNKNKERLLSDKNPSYAHLTNFKDYQNLEEYLTENYKLGFNAIQKHLNIRPRSLRWFIYEYKLEDKFPELSKYSEPELYWKNFLDSLGLIENKDYQTMNRTLIKPLEVDFYLPDYNLALEINPTWTHKVSEKRENNYHQNKFLKLELLNIELISIFDWHDKEKMKEFIINKIQKTKNVIYARKLTSEVKENNKKIRQFIEENHLLGYSKIQNFIATSLLKDNEDNIIAVGIFTKTKKSNRAELKRLVFKSGYSVPGGASKIISNFHKEYPEYDELMTYSDNDLGSGNVYRTLGFDLIEISQPQINWHNPKLDWTIKNLTLVMQGADRLLKDFPGYTPVGIGENLPSNQEIIQQYGFLEVRDCGYKKWLLKF